VLFRSLGSRGHALSPLLAAHLAALIADAPSPLPRTAAMRLDPARLITKAGH
jgi:glycine/D-amino acid oxidase-like deaminating enzyme